MENINNDLDPDDFVNKPKGFLKKNYIYVTKAGDVKIKNLGVKKKSNSLLSRKIFWEVLVPKIKEGEHKFSKVFLKNVIDKLLKQDLNLAAMRKDVGTWEQYKDSSPNGLQAQISKRYGPGIHFMIPITENFGVGKGKHYCTVAEFKEKNFRLDHINLNNVWKELGYFTKKPIVKNIFSFESKDDNKEKTEDDGNAREELEMEVPKKGLAKFM